MPHTYYVYILTNTSRTLYVGVTNNLERRVYEHRMKRVPGFTKDYNVTILVDIESFATPGVAIAREKQLKNWTRAKKIRLIESLNPTWEDLAAEWYAAEQVQVLDE